MIVARCLIELELYGVMSLKDKRNMIKPIIVRLPRQFNVAIAEVDYHNVWNKAVLGIVTVGNDKRYLQGLLEKSVTWIERTYPDLPVGDYSIELD